MLTVPDRIVFFLMNIHASRRTIYFTRSGPSRIEHSYKADSELSPLGLEYADRLAEFIKKKRRELRAARIAVNSTDVSPSKRNTPAAEKSGLDMEINISEATPRAHKSMEEAQHEARQRRAEEAALKGKDDDTPIKRPAGPRRDKTSRGEHMPLTVWSSTRRRCIETTKPLALAGYRVLVRSQMNEVSAAACLISRARADPPLLPSYGR